MAIKKRNELKESFRKGAIPSQEDFGDIFDSFIHRSEDGWFGEDTGVKLSPTNFSQNLMSFIKDINTKSVIWSIKAYNTTNDSFGLNLVDKDGNSKITIDNNGFIGIGTLTPQTNLDINGTLQCSCRRGSYKSGKVLGDGKWHKIIENSTDCSLFEITAKINKYGLGQHAIIHAIAANAFNGKRKEIRTTSACYGKDKQLIELQWTGTDFKYNLEIRTRQNYDNNCYIEYYITNLWF
ncbi:MAG: adhesin [Cytophagales bacterium]|nr:adhesin [Cytophagales bacterium]